MAQLFLQVSALYLGRYKMGSDNISAVLRLLRHVLTQRGLGSLLRHEREEL